MKKALLVLVLLAITMGVVIFLDRPEKHKDVGLWAYVPFDALWVNVENDNVPNANTSFNRGQSCVLEFGGRVTVVKVSGDRYTLRYENPRGRNGGGTVCGNGTLYLIVGRPNFEQMNRSYFETTEAIYVEKHNIRAALRKGPTGGPFTVKQDGWFAVKNPDGIENGNGFHEFNETCSVKTGGRLTPMGTVTTRGGSVRLLHEYWNPGGSQGFGARCGNGALLYY